MTQYPGTPPWGALAVEGRSYAAIACWTSALPASTYDLRLVPHDSDDARPVMCRRLDRASLLGAVPWLRARNAAGYHVYCRPADTRFVLVDDLDPDSLDLVTGAHRVAAVVETSPWCYQAWLMLSANPVPFGIAGAAARLLARCYGGDPGAANAAQLGRLPGLTNKKPCHEREDGSYPYALLRSARGGVDPAGTALLAEVADLNTAEPAERASARIVCNTGGLTSTQWRFEADEAARRVVVGLPPGVGVDRSRLDYAAARRVLARGGSIQDAASVVLAGERARSMPPHAALTYAKRTAAAAQDKHHRLPPVRDMRPA